MNKAWVVEVLLCKDSWAIHSWFYYNEDEAQRSLKNSTLNYPDKQYRISRWVREESK
jgi:hypothetical protein